MSRVTGSASRAAARTVAAWRSGPLANRSFRLLTAGQLTSTVGDYCYAVALPWLVLSAHGGPVLLGTVLACYGVPRTVLVRSAAFLPTRWARGSSCSAPTPRAAAWSRHWWCWPCGT